MNVPCYRLTVLPPKKPPPAPTPRRRWWHRFRRPRPSTCHRCLAVHMAGARPTSALR